MKTVFNRVRPGRGLVRFAALSLLALAASLLPAGEARAQFTTSGTNTTTTNSVGVGTGAPEQLLHVNGPTEILTTGVGAGFKFRNRGSASNTDDWVWYSLDNVARFWRSGIGDLHGFTTDGKVGIGTISPNQRLGVQGMLGLYPQAWVAPTARGMFMYHGGEGAAIYSFNYPGNSGDPLGLSASRISFSTYTGSTGHHRMTLANNGNLGIGTESPATRLDVVGAVNIWDGVSFAVTSGYMASGSLTIGNGNANFGGGTSWNTNTAALMLEASDNTEIAVHDWGTRIASFMYFEGAAANRLTIGRDMGWGAIGTVSINGNVGIGTAAPGFKLDVQGGALNAAGGLCIAGDCKTSWSQLGGGQWTSASSGISYSSGNVGIGTPSPGSKLDVLQANGTAVRALSGSATAHTAVQVGRTAAEASLGVAGGAGHYTLDSAAGDIILRTEATTSKLLLATGPGMSALAVAGSNVGIGTTSPNSKLHVAGDITVDGNINAKYQDVAEWVPSTQKLAAGTVVILDPERTNQVLASTSSYDTAVAGVISAQPGISLGEKGEGKVLVATTGRVKVRVDATKAPVKIGDLLVTSDVSGVAMKSEPMTMNGRKFHSPGTIIGKALEPLANGVGEILVLLSLQ